MPPKRTTKSRTTTSRSRTNEVDQPMETEEEMKTNEDQVMEDVNTAATTVRSQRKRRATEPDNKEVESATVNEPSSAGGDGRRSKRTKRAPTPFEEVAPAASVIKETKISRGGGKKTRGAAASPSPDIEVGPAAAVSEENEDEVDEVDGGGGGEDEDVNMEPASHWLDEHKSELWSNQLPSSIRSMIQDFISVKDLSAHFAAVSKDGYAMVRAYSEFVSAKQQKLDEHSAVDPAAPETQLSFDDAHLAALPSTLWDHHNHLQLTITPGRPYKRCIQGSSGLIGARTEQSRVTSTVLLKLLCGSPLRGVVVRLRADNGSGHHEFGTLKISSSVMNQVCTALPGLRSLHCVIGSDKATAPIRFPRYLRQLRIGVVFVSQRHLTPKEKRARFSSSKGGWSAAFCDQFVKVVYGGVSRLPNLVAFTIEQANAPGYEPSKAVPNDEWMTPIAKLTNLKTLAGSNQFIRFGHASASGQVLNSLPRLTSIQLAALQPISFDLLAPCKHLKYVGGQTIVNDASIPVLVKVGSSFEVLRPRFWLTPEIAWLGKMTALIELVIIHSGKQGQMELGRLLHGRIFQQPVLDDGVKSEFDPDELTDALVNLTRLELLHVTCHGLCGRHLKRLAAKLNRLRELWLKSDQLDTLEWTSDEQVAGNKWPETLEMLAIHAPAIPPSDAHHLRSLRSLTSLSIWNSFSGPLKASQLFDFTLPSTFLPKLKQFVARGFHEPVPPEEVTCEQLEKQRAEMDERARAGELKPAEGSASQQLAWMMQFLTTKEFCAAAATCRAWRGAASLPSAWGRYNTNSSLGRNGRILILYINSPAFKAELIPQLILCKNATRVRLSLPDPNYGDYNPQPIDSYEKPLLQLIKLTRIDDLSMDCTNVAMGPLHRYLTLAGPKLRGASLTALPTDCFQYLHQLHDLTLEITKPKFTPGLELFALKQLNRLVMETVWLDGRLGEGIRQLTIDGQLTYLKCTFENIPHGSFSSYDPVQNIRTARIQELREIVPEFVHALAGLETKLNPPPTAKPTQEQPSVYEGRHTLVASTPTPTNIGVGLHPAPIPPPAAPTNMVDVNGPISPVWTHLPRRPSSKLLTLDLTLNEWRSPIDISPLFRLVKLVSLHYSQSGNNNRSVPIPFDLSALEGENALSSNLHELQLCGRMNPYELNSLSTLQHLRRLTLVDIGGLKASDHVTLESPLRNELNPPEIVFTVPHGSRGRPTISTATMIAFTRLRHLESLTFTRYDLKLDDLYHLKNSSSLTSLGIHECIGLPLLTRAELPEMSEPNEEEEKGDEAADTTPVDSDDQVTKKKPTPCAHALEAARIRTQSQSKCPIGCQRLGYFDLIPGNDLISLVRQMTNLKRFTYSSDPFITRCMASWTVERTKVKRTTYHDHDSRETEVGRQIGCLIDLIVERSLLHQTPLEVDYMTLEYYDATISHTMRLIPSYTNLVRVSSMLGLPIPSSNATQFPWAAVPNKELTDYERRLQTEVNGEIQALEVAAQREVQRHAYVPKKKKRAY